MVRPGKFVAKTVDGKLKFSGGKTLKSMMPQVRESHKNLRNLLQEDSSQLILMRLLCKVIGEEDVSKKGDTSQSDVEVPDTDPSQYDGVVVVFGRFNPPTTGHQKLLQKQVGSI